MTRPTCQTCAFAEPMPIRGDGIFACHLNPPDFQGNFPIVPAASWCSRHSAAAAAAVPTPHPEKITRPLKASQTRGR
jgi:hypothetical protein